MKRMNKLNNRIQVEICIYLSNLFKKKKKEKKLLELDCL